MTTRERIERRKRIYGRGFAVALAGSARPNPYKLRGAWASYERGRLAGLSARASVERAIRAEALALRHEQKGCARCLMAAARAAGPCLEARALLNAWAKALCAVHSDARGEYLKRLAGFYATELDALQET